MTLPIQPIFDRTSEDVALAEANRRNVDANKGAWNVDVDLNRIETNCRYIAEQLFRIGNSVAITTKTDWNMDDKPTLTDVNRIRGNVELLRDKFYTMFGNPAIRYWNGLTWEDANSLEENLHNLDILLDRMKECFRRCGQFSIICGNEVMLP